MMRRFVAAVLIASAVAAAVSMVRASAAVAPQRACHVFCGPHATPLPIATPTPSASPSGPPTPTPTDIPFPTPTGGPSLPPTPTPIPFFTPTPRPESPLPGGDAPQIIQPTPSGVTLTSTLPTGGAPQSTSNPLGTFVLIAFLVLLGLTVGSSWLYLKLR